MRQPRRQHQQTNSNTTTNTKIMKPMQLRLFSLLVTLWVGATVLYYNDSASRNNDSNQDSTLAQFLHILNDNNNGNNSTTTTTTTHLRGQADDKKAAAAKAASHIELLREKRRQQFKHLPRSFGDRKFLSLSSLRDEQRKQAIRDTRRAIEEHGYSPPSRNNLLLAGMIANGTQMTSRPRFRPTTGRKFVRPQPKLNGKLDNMAPTWKDVEAEKTRAFASLQETNRSVPEAPVNVIRLNHNENNTRTNGTTNDKPLMAIVLSARSVPGSSTPQATYLYKYMLKGVLATVTEQERKDFFVHVYIGIDDIDEWWIHHGPSLQRLLPSWLPVTFGVFAKKPNRIPFNEMAYYAYHHDKADYFCRINDDTQLLSPRWISLSVNVLRNYRPINVGVTGPKTMQGNSAILTHDFVHRTHLDIFEGWYYPPSFHNWFLDDWISFQYSAKVLGENFNRVTTLPDFKVKHWIKPRRYNVKFADAQWLPAEYERGRRLIRKYLLKQEQQLAAGDALPMPVDEMVPRHRPKPVEMAPNIVEALEAALASPSPDGSNQKDHHDDTGSSNKTLLMWSLDVDSHYWYTATTGRVTFLNDRSIGPNEWVRATDSFIRVESVGHHTVMRGNAGAHEHSYRNYVEGQDATNNTWCSLEMSTLPKHIYEDGMFWDVIWVSAPVISVMHGTNNTSMRRKVEYGPGVFQSMYQTQKLVVDQFAHNTPKTEVHLFINHYERPHEREFASKLFEKEPASVLVHDQIENMTYAEQNNGGDPVKVAHFIITPEDTIVQRRLKPSTNATSCPRGPVVQESRKWNLRAEWPHKHLGAILNAIPGRGNVLIWGKPDSSPLALWEDTTHGRVVFLHDPARPIEGAKEAYQIQFGSFNVSEMEEKAKDGSGENPFLTNTDWKTSLEKTFLANNQGALEHLLTTKWDVILINGPAGKFPHRLESIYLSMILARNTQQQMSHDYPTRIFIRHDHEFNLETLLKQALQFPSISISVDDEIGLPERKAAIKKRIRTRKYKQGEYSIGPF